LEANEIDLDMVRRYMVKYKPSKSANFLCPTFGPHKMARKPFSSLTIVHKVLAGICGNQFFEAIVRSMLKITAEMVQKREIQ
jgi:hypothetical protein